MKMKSLMRNRKAFSAVIAALILMLLAVAAGAVVYAYVMGWIGGVQQNTPNQGILQIDSATADVSSNKITVYVRNVGSTDLILSSFYIDGIAKTNATSPITVSLPKLSTACFQVSAGLTLDPNQFYEVKVACTDGTQISQQVEAK